MPSAPVPVEVNGSCPHCGRSVQTSDAFCRGCGRALDRQAEATPEALPAADIRVAPSAPKRLSRQVIGLGLGGAILAGALVLLLVRPFGPGGLGSGPLLAGTVLVPQGGDAAPGECRPWTSYLDIRTGLQVTITDESGETVGITHLQPADDFIIAAEKTGDEFTDALHTKDCQFEFSAELSKADARFYSVTIGGRDGPTYSRSELETLGWRISLALPPTL